VAAEISDRTRLIEAYNAAVTSVNKAVDDANSSLHAVDEMPHHDLAALNSQLAAVQVFSSLHMDLIIFTFAFSALTLLVGHQEEHTAHKN